MGMTMTQKIFAAHAGLDSVRAGAEVSFDFDPSLMHLFDKETEQNLL